MNKFYILTTMFILMFTLTVSAQERKSTEQSSTEGNKVIPMSEMTSPWDQEKKLKPSEVFLIDFLTNSSREIGQVATCSAKEAQIMWHCTVSILLDWKTVSNDENFEMTDEMEAYVKNFLLSSSQASYSMHSKKKEKNKFTCKDAVTIRKSSAMFDICEVVEEKR